MYVHIIIIIIIYIEDMRAKKALSDRNVFS